MEEANKKLNSMLPNYGFLFKDLNLLYKVFNKVAKDKEREGYFFNESFKFFLKWVFEELYAKKIIDKKIFNELNRFLTTFHLESRKMGPGETAGAGLGF